MTLTLATLLPGIGLLVLGVLFLVGNSAIVTSLKALPRSRVATAVFFGGATLWFLWKIWTLSEADFGEYRKWLFVGFAGIAVGSFIYVPDFLAVRGLAALMLLAATPLLDAAYMEYTHPQRLWMVSAVFVGISLAIYLGAAPFRLRDFFGWLFSTSTRSRALGGFLTVYGLLLAAVAFTY